MTDDSKKPVHIKLSDERRNQLLQDLMALFQEEFDEEISLFRAQQILNFFIGSLGPTVYNQAISDSQGFFSARIEELGDILYERDGKK